MNSTKQKVLSEMPYNELKQLIQLAELNIPINHYSVQELKEELSKRDNIA